MPVPEPVVVSVQSDAVLVNGNTIQVATLDTVSGNRRIVQGTLAFPTGANNGYTPGGNAIDPYMFGLSVLDRLQLDPGRNSSDKAIIARLKTATPLKGSPNPANAAGLIEAFWAPATASAPFDEVGNGDDISGYPIPFTAWGVA